MDEAKTFMIEDARIVYRNFEGKETMFKPAGTRTFAAVLPKELANKMAADGWNVKCKPPRDEDEEEFCHIEVTIGYKVRPPKIVRLVSVIRTIFGGRTL